MNTILTLKDQRPDEKEKFDKLLELAIIKKSSSAYRYLKVPTNEL